MNLFEFVQINELIILMMFRLLLSMFRAARSFPLIFLCSFVCLHVLFPVLSFLSLSLCMCHSLFTPARHPTKAPATMPTMSFLFHFLWKVVNKALILHQLEIIMHTYCAIGSCLDVRWLKIWMAWKSQSKKEYEEKKLEWKRNNKQQITVHPKNSWIRLKLFSTPKKEREREGVESMRQQEIRWI